MRYRIGRYEDSFADLEAARALARELGDRSAEAEIILDAATALDWVSDYARSSALVDEAETLGLTPPSPALHARLVLGKGRSLLRQDRWGEASAALEEAAAVAESVGDEAYETLIISLVLLEAALASLHRVDEAEQASERAIALSRERGDQLHFIAAVGNRRSIRIARRDVPGAIEDLETQMRIGREIGMLLAEYFGEVDLGILLYQTGELEQAVEHARRAMAIEDRHPEIARSAPLGMLCLARIEAYRGHERETRDLLRRVERALQIAAREEQASAALTPSQRVLVSMLDLATREATTAEWEALLERSARESIEQEPIEVADLYGTWALRRGRIEEARRAFEEAARRAERIPNVMEGRVQRGLAATAGPGS
jgi:tetratricopeptide (TPR) repeat protein